MITHVLLVRKASSIEPLVRPSLSQLSTNPYKGFTWTYLDLPLLKALIKKSYCLVVTDDYSSFTWVFFLATKDETSPILKTFIIGLENQLSLKNTDGDAAFDEKEPKSERRKPESKVNVSPRSSAHEWKDNLLSLSDLLDNRKQRIFQKSMMTRSRERLKERVTLNL
uniref:Putative ribonuclease H-like domain-containing protein n=1 Tax=Tanacetum cinerariifolium TaxID=118510 RepID=A0A699TY66_TANCI|nr:putative ribonuclease H-like domain-containing protein [Tanacetum cinerariifolium]